MCTVIIPGSDYGHRALAVRNRSVIQAVGSYAGTKFGRSTDTSCYIQLFNFRAIHIAKESAVVFLRNKLNCDGFVISKECAGKHICTVASHFIHSDVAVKPDIFSVKRVSAAHLPCEGNPVAVVFYDIR